MGKYAVTFRIADRTVAGHTYGERYSSLVDAIRKFEPNWQEPTSFALVSSASTAETVNDYLYINSHLNSAADLLLVINIETGTAVVRGPVSYPATLGLLVGRLIKK